jgi:hypothetical protein
MLGHGAFERVSRAGIHASGRLVEQQDARPTDGDRGYRGALSLA